MMFQKIIRGFAENPKSLFLFDGLGALVSAFLLGVVLVKFESTFGMPKEKLYFLAGAACLFVIYDLVCYFKANQNWSPLVKGKKEVRKIYQALFDASPNLFSKIIKRITFDNKVIDHESISGRMGKEELVEMVLIYEVKDEKIIKITAIKKE